MFKKILIANREIACRIIATAAGSASRRWRFIRKLIARLARGDGR
jgi:hypothetical protein